MKKKLLYITQVFEVLTDTGSDRDYNYCKFAVNKNLNVNVITSNVDYKKSEKRNNLNESTTIIDGINIKYVYSYSNIRGSLLKRVLYYISFIIPAVWSGLKEKKPNLIYSVSTPLFVGLIGVLLSKIRRTKHIFEVTDIWPDAIIACGLIKNKMAIKALKMIELYIYKNSDAIIVLANDAKKNLISKNIPENKIHVVTNGFDPILFSRQEMMDDDAKKHLKIKYRIPQDDMIFMYLGAHGMYNSLDTIIEAAKLSIKNRKIHFVFVGDGDSKEKLVEEKVKSNLSNVTFIPSVNRKESIELLTLADVFLLPNKLGRFFEGNLPNKLFDYMATGKPIISNCRGEIADVLNNAKCGSILEPENFYDLHTAIEEYSYFDKDKLNKLGLNGKNYCLSNYSRSILSSKIHEIVTELIEKEHE